MANKVLRIFHDFSSKNRQNFLSNFARCESLLTSCPRIFCVYLRLDSNYKNRKKLHMFLFIGDVTSVQCITSVLNNTKAGRLLSSAQPQQNFRVALQAGPLGQSVRPGKVRFPPTLDIQTSRHSGHSRSTVNFKKPKNLDFQAKFQVNFWDLKNI